MVEGVKIVAPWPLILALFLRQISFLKKKTSSKIFDGAFLQISGVAPFVALFGKIVASSDSKLLTTLVFVIVLIKKGGNREVLYYRLGRRTRVGARGNNLLLPRALMHV